MKLAGALCLLYRDSMVKSARPWLCFCHRLGTAVLAAAVAVAAAPCFSTSAEARPKKPRVTHHARVKSVKRPPERSVKLASRTPVSSEDVNEADEKQPPIPVMTREAVLGSEAQRLERIGRHIIVGYRSFADVKMLVEKRAIAGIFITDHNVRGHKAADVKAQIDSLQDIRKAQGLPPLIVAADQEGGQVSRLSPPLKKQASLGSILKNLPHDAERQAAVEAYAQTQAEELKRIGVTLNFAPVVDLKLDVGNRDDGETHLRARAIAADPYLVAKVAGWYCDVLAKSAIMCTLKHFPGLGRVKRDTHVVSGEVAATEGQLELNDWVPFRRLMSKTNVATMLGHVRVIAIDKSTPASFSHKVIRNVIRETWHHDGLLITDDLSMGGVTRSKAGIGRAAVQSLDAGADLLLISYIEQHYDIVMSALLHADADNSLDAGVRRQSEDRIARVLSQAAGVP